VKVAGGRRVEVVSFLDEVLSADDARLEMARGRWRRRWAADVREGQEGTTCRVCHRRGWQEWIGGDGYRGGDGMRLGGGDRGN
jgi:hypothetical protein